MAKKKTNYLLEKIITVVQSNPKGKVLDLGCGDGKTGKRLLDSGYDVEACDMDKERFEYESDISFVESNFTDRLPYENETFDYVIFMEVIEHIYNPDHVISEISRILKSGGKLIISTPNILNIGSRFRFLIESSFDFFREPILDYSKSFPMAIQNMHVIPWRYQELEYLLFRNSLEMNKIHADKLKMDFYFLSLLLKPLIYFQGKCKERKSKQRDSVDFSRVNKILLSDEILLGRHLILEVEKKILGTDTNKRKFDK